MRRYTTPTHTIKLKGSDFTACEVHVTYRQGLYVFDIGEPDVTYDGHDTVITVHLSQRQTARFKRGTAEIQVNVIDIEGSRNTTAIKEFEVGDNLLERVLSYG